MSDQRKGAILRLNNSLKSFISREQNIFEGLNIRYFGPIDGHDVGTLVKVLHDIKDMKGPRILHIKTKKGKGYAPAEKDPSTWHAPGRFNPATGEIVKAPDDGKPHPQRVHRRKATTRFQANHRARGCQRPRRRPSALPRFGGGDPNRSDGRCWSSPARIRK